MIIPFDEQSKKQLTGQLMNLLEVEKKSEFLMTVARDLYEKRENEIGAEVMRKIERFVMVSVIDTLWMDHLDAIENLRSGIGLRGYGQRDPLVEYKNEAYKMFEQLVSGIDDGIVHRIYKIQIADAPQMHQHQHVVEQPAGSTNGISETSVSSKKSVSKKQKPGRNDPCYCGSGKKYKKCHYPN